MEISNSQWQTARHVADSVVEMFFDNAERFTCSEAEDIAAFLDAWSDIDNIAGRFLDAHSYGDEEGDAHYRNDNGGSPFASLDGEGR